MARGKNKELSSLYEEPNSIELTVVPCRFNSKYDQDKHICQQIASCVKQIDSKESLTACSAITHGPDARCKHGKVMAWLPIELAQIHCETEK